MVTTNIKLNSIKKAKDFAAKASMYNMDIDLKSGRYIIDGKSIMGIFSLDLRKPIEMTINAEANSDECKEFLKSIDEFICK